MRREDKKKHKKLEDFIMKVVESEEDFLLKKIKTEPNIEELCKELEKKFIESLSIEQLLLRNYILLARAEYQAREVNEK